MDRSRLPAQHRFSTAGNLVNAGTLSISGGLSVNGDLTESKSTSVLDFPIAAAANSAGAPSMTVSGATTLAGNLTAENAGGFTAASNTAYAVALFATPPTGSFASTAGTGPVFVPTVTSTGITLAGTGFGDVDLAISNVTAPANVTPGGQGFITWTGTNDSDFDITDNYFDAIYLSNSDTINSSSILVARVQAGPLAAGASYSGSLLASFPGFLGTMNVVVVLDAGLSTSDSHRANNAGASAAITETIPTLTVGSNVSDTLAPGQQRLYKVTLAAGSDIRISASFPRPQVSDIEISHGALPTPATAQFSAPVNGVNGVASTVIASPQPGTYYVLLTGQPTFTGPQAFTLSASVVPPGATSISPSTLGTGGVSVTIKGSGFTGSAAVQLVTGGGTVVANADTTHIVDSDTIQRTLISPRSRQASMRYMSLPRVWKVPSPAGSRCKRQLRPNRSRSR